MICYGEIVDISIQIDSLPTVVEHFRVVGNDEGKDAGRQTFLERYKPSDAVVSVLCGECRNSITRRHIGKSNGRFLVQE